MFICISISFFVNKTFCNYQINVKIQIQIVFGILRQTILRTKPMRWRDDNWNGKKNITVIGLTLSGRILSSRVFLPYMFDYFDGSTNIAGLSPKFPNSLSLSHNTHPCTLKIDDSDTAWEAEPARTMSSRGAGVTSTVPSTQSDPNERIFTADSAGIQSDMHRRMSPSVIYWHGWVLVMAG